jgi:hypothetical protein
MVNESHKIAPLSLKKSGHSKLSDFFLLVNKKNRVIQTRFQVPGPSLKLGSRFFLFLWVFENCRKLRPSFQLGPDIWDRVLNSVSASCYYIAHPAHFSFIFIQSTISSKSSLLVLQELPTKNLFFNRSRADLYSPLSSHQHCKFFSIWTINFCCKIKYTNSKAYCSYCRDKNIADQCVSRRSNPEHFNRRGLRQSCRVHIFYRRDNQSS